MNTAAKPREYKAFPQNAKPKLNNRHGRIHSFGSEKIRRPIGSTPRTAKDWN